MQFIAGKGSRILVVFFITCFLSKSLAFTCTNYASPLCGKKVPGVPATGPAYVISAVAASYTPKTVDFYCPTAGLLNLCCQQVNVVISGPDALVSQKDCNEIPNKPKKTTQVKKK